MPAAGSSSRTSAGSSQSTWASLDELALAVAERRRAGVRIPRKPDIGKDLAAPGALGGGHPGPGRGWRGRNGARRGRRSQEASGWETAAATGRCGPAHACARAKAAGPLDSPSGQGRARTGRRPPVPSIRLNRVVLPEPFGPMKAGDLAGAQVEVHAVDRAEPAERPWTGRGPRARTRRRHHRTWCPADRRAPDAHCGGHRVTRLRGVAETLAVAVAPRSRSG